MIDEIVCLLNLRATELKENCCGTGHPNQSLGLPYFQTEHHNNKIFSKYLKQLSEPTWHEMRWASDLKSGSILKNFKYFVF